MEQITSPSVNKLPDYGYLVLKDKNKENYYKNESHIPESQHLLGIKTGVHKLTNDIFTYFPKGFAGSKNSDFYEYLSLGMVPYLVGSGMLIGLYNGVNKKFNAKDAKSAGLVGKTMAAGVVLYGIGKFAYQKLARKAIKWSTGIDLDMKYIKKVNELPEQGQDKGLVRTQYSGVFDSREFYRSDLLAKDAEMNHNDIYYYDDIITRKAGFKNKLHAPNQTASDKIKKVKARTTALENIGKYVIAATSVALGAQKAFEKVDLKAPKTILEALKDGTKQLWNGSNKSKITKNYGKVLMLGSLATTVLTWLIPTIGFKHNPNTIKTKVDTNKEFEVG